MRFYNIEMKGKLFLQKRTSLPAHNPGEEGRLFYYNDAVYASTSTDNVKVLSENNIDELTCCISACGSINAAQLNGQAGSYYTDMNNATGGVLGVEYGGTGATDSTGFITNFGLDDRYGRLEADNNNWEGTQCFYRDSPGTQWHCATLSTDDLRFRYCSCLYNTYYCTCISMFGMRTFGIWNKQSCLVPGQGGIYYMSCSSGTPGCGIFTVYTDRCYLGCDHAPVATILINNRPNGAGVGLEVCNCGCCSAIWARNCSSCPTIFAEALGGGFAVAGNTAYQNTSSQHLKHLECTCLSNCVRKQPLSIYRYYWEDSNNKGFNMTIGPTAEDFHRTFNLDNSNNGEEYDSIWSLDGAALGLSIENLKEIDKLKKIIIQLYSCIQKLEGEG